MKSLRSFFLESLELISGSLMAFAFAFASSGTVHAQPIERYSIAPDFIAPAPELYPFLHSGDIQDANGITVRGYSATDDHNTIIFNATFPLAAQNHSDAAIFDILRGHVEGVTALYIMPNIEIIQQTTISGSPALTWNVRYELPGYHGYKWTKYGVSIMKDKKIYQWSVTGIDDVSKGDPRAIFLANLRHVQLL